MVAINLCEFAAAYNFAISTKRRSFHVHSTVLNRSFAVYLRQAGYIFGFSKRGRLMEIYPIYGHLMTPYVTAVSTPSRPIYFGPHKLRREFRVGNRYILLSHSGRFCDSYDCLLGNMGGQALIRFS